MGNPLDPLQNYKQWMKLPPASLKTYRVLSPHSTHSRPATCEEVDCENQKNGWVIIADERTREGQYIAAEINRVSRPVGMKLSPGIAARVRRFIKGYDEEGRTVFRFPEGQECFQEHRVSLERPELYVVQGGDIRGNPRQTPPKRHKNGEEWVEDFGEHQQKLHDLQQKG